MDAERQFRIDPVQLPVDLEAEFGEFIAAVDAGGSETAEAEVLAVRMHLCVKLRPVEFEQLLRLFAGEDSALQVVAEEQRVQLVEGPLRTDRLKLHLLTGIVDEPELKCLSQRLRRTVGDGIHRFGQFRELSGIGQCREPQNQFAHCLEDAGGGGKEILRLLIVRLFESGECPVAQSGGAEGEHGVPVGRGVALIHLRDENAAVAEGPGRLKHGCTDMTFRGLSAFAIEIPEEPFPLEMVGESVEGVDADSAAGEKKGEHFRLEADERLVLMPSFVLFKFLFQRFFIRTAFRLGHHRVVLLFQPGADGFKSAFHFGILLRSCYSVYHEMRKNRMNKMEKNISFPVFCLIFFAESSIFNRRKQGEWHHADDDVSGTQSAGAQPTAEPDSAAGLLRDESGTVEELHAAQPPGLHSGFGRGVFVSG